LASDDLVLLTGVLIAVCGHKAQSRLERDNASPSSVMPALVAGIHDLKPQIKGVDGRDKPGHDEES